MNSTKEENRDIGPTNEIQDVVLDVKNEKEQLETKNNSKTFELFLKGLVSVGLGLSISVIFAIFIAPQRAHAATSTASMHKNRTVYSASPRSQEIEMSASKHTPISSTSPGLLVSPNMPRSASESELSSLQSRFGSGTLLRHNKQKKPQARNQSGTIRAAESGSSGLFQIETGQWGIPSLQTGKEILTKFFNKDSMTMNMTEVLTDPHIKMLYMEISNELIDVKRTIAQDLINLKGGLEFFCDYRNVTESTDLSNEADMNLIIQKVSAARALLITDFKRKDSGINKVKYKADKFRLAALWPNYKRKRDILTQQAKERVWSRLKLLLSDDMQALLTDFRRRPHFSISLRVYSYAPMYLRDQWAEIEKIFSLKLNSLEAGSKEKKIKKKETKKKETLLERRLPEVNYWKNLDRYRNSLVCLVDEVEAEAMTFLNNENQSLVGYYNEKNPEQPPYAQLYQTSVGMEPKMPHNRHQMATVPAAFSTPTSESNTNEGEGGYLSG